MTARVPGRRRGEGVASVAKCPDRLSLGWPGHPIGQAPLVVLGPGSASDAPLSRGGWDARLASGGSDSASNIPIAHGVPATSTKEQG
jgi:hypothetical protein